MYSGIRDGLSVDMDSSSADFKSSPGRDSIIHRLDRTSDKSKYYEYLLECLFEFSTSMTLLASVTMVDLYRWLRGEQHKDC